MNRRTKGMLIIGAIWLALMVATVVTFIGNRRTHYTAGTCIRERPNPGLPGTTCLEYSPRTATRVWDGGGFWGWSFAITLAALVAVVIVHVVTVRDD